MIRRMYCIYDLLAKAPANNSCQFLGNDDEAMRMFRDVLMANGTIVNQHPEDFGLCYLGEVNFDDLIVVPSSLPVRPILLGSDVVRDLRARANVERNADSASTVS